MEIGELNFKGGTRWALKTDFLFLPSVIFFWGNPSMLVWGDLCLARGSGPALSGLGKVGVLGGWDARRSLKERIRKSLFLLCSLETCCAVFAGRKRMPGISKC